MRKFAYIIVVLLSLLVVALIAGFSVYKYNIGPVSNDKTLKQIIIEEGDTFSSIAPKLKEKNLIKSEFFYKLYVKFHKTDKFEVGTYDLSEDMDVAQIIEKISEGSTTNAHVINITFVEGKNMRNVAKTIAANTVNTEDDVFNLLKDENYIQSLIDKYWFLTDNIKNSKIYYPLEGYLFPNTYAFLNKDVSVKEIVITMLDETNKQLEPYKSKIEEFTKDGVVDSVHKFMTLASIVELEGASANDRASVAGVFYNRIKEGWVLGSDVTTYYYLKIDDFKQSLNGNPNLYTCDNAYNTRCTSFVGLPVGPISNPGKESIEATANYTKHNYYYFVADCKGKTYLSKDPTEHYNTIQRLKNEGNWCV